MNLWTVYLEQGRLCIPLVLSGPARRHASVPAGYFTGPDGLKSVVDITFLYVDTGPKGHILHISGDYSWDNASLGAARAPEHGHGRKRGPPRDNVPESAPGPTWSVLSHKKQGKFKVFWVQIYVFTKM